MYKGLTQNLQAAIASGKNPDVVQMGYSYLNYAGENLNYADITEFIAKQSPEDKAYLEYNYLPNVLALAKTDDGKLIGIPYSISVPVVYYNPDISVRLGLLQQAAAYLAGSRRVCQSDQGQDRQCWFLYAGICRQLGQQALIESNGGQVLARKDGRAVAGFDLPEAAEAYQLLADMVKDGTALHATNEEGFQYYLAVSWAWCVQPSASGKTLKRAPSLR